MDRSHCLVEYHGGGVLTQQEPILWADNSPLPAGLVQALPLRAISTDHTTSGICPQQMDRLGPSWCAADVGDMKARILANGARQAQQKFQESVRSNEGSARIRGRFGATHATTVAQPFIFSQALKGPHGSLVSVVSAKQKPSIASASHIPGAMYSKNPSRSPTSPLRPIPKLVSSNVACPPGDTSTTENPIHRDRTIFGVRRIGVNPRRPAAFRPRSPEQSFQTLLPESCHRYERIQTPTKSRYSVSASSPTMPLTAKRSISPKSPSLRASELDEVPPPLVLKRDELLLNDGCLESGTSRPQGHSFSPRAQDTNRVMDPLTGSYNQPSGSPKAFQQNYLEASRDSAAGVLQTSRRAQRSRDSASGTRLVNNGWKSEERAPQRSVTTGGRRSLADTLLNAPVVIGGRSMNKRFERSSGLRHPDELDWELSGTQDLHGRLVRLRF